MCLAARGQKNPPPDSWDYVGEEKLPHALPANEARQRTAPPQVVWGKNASACPLRQRGTPGNRPAAGGAGEEKLLHALPANGGRQGTAPPQVVWGKKNFRMPSQRAGGAREAAHRRRQAPAPHFPQVVDRGRAGILQWRKQRRTKGEWSHEAGTDRTRTLRLQQ